MDNEGLATARLDSIIEADLARGFRVRMVPPDVRQVLELNGFAAPLKVKFLAMNARRRADINTEVQRRYFKDLQDPEVLSNAQIRKLVEERGEWSTADDHRMTELNEKVQLEMLDLWREGFSDNGEVWKREILDQGAIIQTELEREDVPTPDRARFAEVFERWSKYEPELQVEYTVGYAAEQGLDSYSPDRDLNTLLNLSPNILVADALNQIEELRDKQRRLIKLVVDMKDLQLLRVRHARIFSGSAESRQSNAEELAQIYFACEPLDELDKPTAKRLIDTFDKFYEWPFEATRWFIYEAYFFHNDIPEVAAQQYLEAYGFRKAEREPKELRGENEPSDVSPDPQPSSSGSAPVAMTPADSSASLVGTATTA